MLAACRILLLLSCLSAAGVALADADVAASSHLRIGGEVRITEAVEGPLRIIGGEVTVDAPVKGSVKVAGGNVTLGPAAVVSGDVAIAGGNVTVEGAIKGKLRAAGGNVRINGPVDGDASIAAGKLELAPNARIEGKLRFRGEELRQDPAAQVKGGVDQEAGVAHEHGFRWSSHPQRTPAERFLHGWLWSLGLVMLAALIAAALPGATQRMAAELRERPWITPLLGLVALTAIPVAAVLVMITIIGIPIGLLALIGYAALLLLGYVWVAVVVGGMLLDRVKPATAARTAWHAGAAALAMLVLAILVRVPFVGGFVKLAALVVGVGMIVAVVMRVVPRAPSAPTPA